MEDIDHFDDFYEKKLAPCLADLQLQGNRTYNWGIAAVISGVLIIPALAFGLRDAAEGYGGFMILVVVVTAVVSIYNYTKTKDAYEDNYKEQVIRQIIQFINPSLDYKPDICINHTDYKNSSLCRRWYDDYDGADWIGGNYKGVNFKCCELNVSRRSGPRRDTTVYHGLFFVAPLNISFSGGTYVWIRGDEQLGGSMAEEYRMLPMPEVVRVDCRNGEFEKHYAVYTTDVYEASSLIDDRMMHAIVNFKKQINRDISLSFVAGICYVAIPINEDLFEPNGDEPGDKEAIQKYFFTVLLILGIINKLQLDRL